MKQSSRPPAPPARRWGRSPEHAPAHAAAARMQTRCPGLVIWFGETSGRFYVMDSQGLHDFPDADAVLLFAWQRTARPAGEVPRQERSGVVLGVRRDPISAPPKTSPAARQDFAPAPACAAGTR